VSARTTGPRVVYSFEYRDTLVRFAISEYRGRVYLDIRSFWQPSPDKPWQPTKKGFRHNIEVLGDWQAGLAAREAAVDGIDTRSARDPAA